MTDTVGDEVYGDTDPNNLPDGEAASTSNAASSGSQTSATSSDDGRPGVALDGDGRWRAGAFANANNLLGVARASDCGPTLASDGKQVYPVPHAYVTDGQGRLQLRPDAANTLPSGPFDFAGNG